MRVTNFRPPHLYPSPVKGEGLSLEVYFTADDKSTNVLLSSPTSTRGLGLVLIV